jgi:hypothetical protein
MDSAVLPQCHRPNRWGASGCYPLRRINAPARLAAGNHRKAIKGSDPKAKISPLDHIKTATSSVGKGNAKDRNPSSQHHPLS